MISTIEKLEIMLKEVFEEEKAHLNNIVEPIVIKKEVIDPIDKKREEKRWKHSFGYYCLHPDEFRFGLRDFKQEKLKRF